MKLSDIAKQINGELTGNDCDITGVSDLDNQNSGTIAYADNKRNLEILSKSTVSAIILPKTLEFSAKPVIHVENPKLSFSKVLEIFSPYRPYRKKMYPNVYIEKSAKLGKEVTILPFTNIMDNAEIGDGTIIYSQVFIGKNVKIGKNCIIKAGVKIDDETTVGDNVIIHHNTVVGGDGFGYLQLEGKNVKILQVGKIIIEDDVEIGALVAIDRATIGKTVIGKGTKIDNMVQIAHNVVIGENSIIISQVGIGGSSTIGKNCIITGQVGIADHVKIGDNVLVLAQSGIESKQELESGKVYFGSPAREMMEMKRIYSAQKRLPEMVKAINEIKKKLGIQDEQP
jgi:UDP-3-O-[3-hydroxymyristoyl] glucosamine N-acyltransferase